MGWMFSDGKAPDTSKEGFDIHEVKGLILTTPAHENGVDVEEFPAAEDYYNTLVTYPEDNLPDANDEGFSILPDWLTNGWNVFTNDNVNLDDHEQVNGGHTIERHVGKNDEFLEDRLRNPEKYVPGQRDIPASSCYTDKATAEQVIGQTIQQNQAEIEAWLGSSPDKTIDFTYNGNNVIGRGISKGETEVLNKTNATVVLKKSNSGGYTVLTSYPK